MLTDNDEFGNLASGDQVGPTISPNHHFGAPLGWSIECVRLSPTAMPVQVSTATNAAKIVSMRNETGPVVDAPAIGDAANSPHQSDQLRCESEDDEFDDFNEEDFDDEFDDDFEEEEDDFDYGSHELEDNPLEGPSEGSDKNDDSKKK